MKLQIEHCPGEVQVTVRGPEGSAELQTIVALLQSESDRMWLLNEQQETVAVSLRDILGRNRVPHKFLYHHLLSYSSYHHRGMQNQQRNIKKSILKPPISLNLQLISYHQIL